MAADWQPGLFALPPGVDFAQEFVAGFLDRMAGQPPEAIARATIYANSGRTLTAIKAAFDACGALLLPRLRIVTDLGAGPAAAMAPLEAPLARRLQLGRLVAGLSLQRQDLAAGHSIPELAQSLSELMTEMQTEGCGPDALSRIDPGEHARHWQNALQFLGIAAGFYLREPPVDRAARQRAAAESVAANWAEGRDLPAAPVFVAGSTGSHGATRLFMQAVASLPNGAVVLPGFDFDQPDAIWDGLDHTAEDHPQARFAPLIRAAGYPSRWTDRAAPVPERNALMSLALRPAPVTEQWIADGPMLGDLEPATHELTLIEADTLGQEAETIALIMRDAVERMLPITLICADGGLVRRVTAALDRWHLVPDDSAGQPLPMTAPGLFLRQVAGLFGQPLTIDALLGLLKHPVTASGSDQLGRNDLLRLTRDLELKLRREGPVFPDGDELREWATRGDALQKVWAEWLAAVLDRIGALADDRAARPLADRAADHLALASDLAAGPGGQVAASRLWQGDDGAQAQSLLAHLTEHADQGPPMRPGDFADLLRTEMQPLAVRADPAFNHLIRFRGPREARTNAHGTVILAGLNEGGWPGSLEPDPWLSRQMRLEAGLTLPERRIGLAAHDFQQGMGADRVILTRARRDDTAETIPSRWLNRLTNLLDGLPDQGGKTALAQMRARGGNWLAMAAALARPEARVDPARRPAPIPPAPALTKLSATDVATLIRDPYAIYAKRVLGLRALDPLRPEPDAMLRGTALHMIVQCLLESRPDADTPPETLKARLLHITGEVLDEQVPWPSARAFWLARIAGIAERLVSDELARLQLGHPAVIERQQQMAVADTGLVLTAKPDRIDMLNDGRAQVYDYKSGAPPKDSDIEASEKQLLLEAVMVENGAFDSIGPSEVAGISYIQLGDKGETHDRSLPGDLMGDFWDRFVSLIRAYLSGDAGFAAMRSGTTSRFAGDYEHLARFGEWDLSDPAQPRKVGGDG
ncbi:double-strand break repair protein AddB [Paracoccus tegillarcae]|uniref:Double-strand break repair protein AddB n=1 Tax=Paracoccus tegillarcae TaxID=1529068 RepID=A0A2K9EVB5_9RHOB|nr:double-strand break repair protein AddB [Paracoccus tegillarcae]AUH33214.1 double-strand break repair protein AddB [Paracoccus tegillarcae]